jgi:hypothetical protein
MQVCKTTKPTPHLLLLHGYLNKTTSDELRHAVNGHCHGVLYCQNVIRFHSTRVEVIKLGTITEVQPPSAYFTKHAPVQQISHTEFHTR